MEGGKFFTVRINGKNYRVGRNVSCETTLLTYIRDVLKLPGTKSLCRAGGCGACTVVATFPDQETRKPKTVSVHACQTLLYLCSGWSVETIEHLGNRYKGYHSLQKVLSGFYGTQCGFCSPGMVMTAYGQLKSKGYLTAEMVEKSLGGNICRCTGYRPILDAFKSLAADGLQELKDRVADIEEAFESRCRTGAKLCTRQTCSEGDSRKCSFNDVPSLCLDTEVGEKERNASGSPDAEVGDVRWFHPSSVESVCDILKKIAIGKTVRFVVGNTGSGVFEENRSSSDVVYINMNSIRSLYVIDERGPLVIGANASISRVIQVFGNMAATDGYGHLKELADHWNNVANTSVRNIGCWAGNLMMKHNHKEFPSDIFLTLLVAKAKVTICNLDNSKTEVDLEGFLKTNMDKSFIVAMTLPAMPRNTYIRTYKICPRSTNAFAYVNAAFHFSVDPSKNYLIQEQPCLAYGGISSDFVRASHTESLFINETLTSSLVIRGAKSLAREVHPDTSPLNASAAYRISLCQTLLYKTVVGILGESISPAIHSAAFGIPRPISSGQQSFDPNKETWPAGKAMPKLEANIQVAGEAEYLDDIPTLENELHGAFVQTTIAKGKIKKVDPTKALKAPGVVAFLSASDIPGENTFIDAWQPDEVFLQSEVRFAGQALGLVVATSRDLALSATRLVEVTYEDIKKPILSIREALKTRDYQEILKDTSEDVCVGDVAESLRSSPLIIEGDFDLGGQAHFAMETMAGRVVPIEDGYDVWCTTQCPTRVQEVISEVLQVPSNSINLTVRRLGGAFGHKISRSSITAAAAAVAAAKLQRPVRVVLDLKTQMTLLGWREPYYAKYKVGCDEKGKLKAVSVLFVGDAGHVSNESSAGFAFSYIPNVYQAESWSLKPRVVNTDTAANTWCRSPGMPHAIAVMENIMEHLAAVLKKDPLEVREMNLLVGKNRPINSPKGENMVTSSLLPLLKEKATVSSRKSQIEDYNKKSRWKKRGLSVVPLFYGYDYPASFAYGVHVAVYGADGSVSVEHGGIEMGQGINTKVAQVAAHVLGISMDMIKIKPTSLIVGANSSVTGGSFGSDLVSFGTKKACLDLRSRIDPVRDRLKQRLKRDPTWLEVIKKSLSLGVDLCARFWSSRLERPAAYDIWAVGCLEVEVDLLTGEYLIRRVDIIEDCGHSLNPYVDIGQIEGAFVMGLGLFTTELVVYDQVSGQKLSNNTKDYTPPTAVDIPADFRVTLLPNSSQPNPPPDFGVLRSKATGEPAVSLSYAVVTALRAAIAAGRAEAGLTDWFEMSTPLTVERIQRLCAVSPDQFSLTSLEEQENLEDTYVFVHYEDICDS